MGYVEEHRVEFIVELTILGTTIGRSIWRWWQGGSRDMAVIFAFFYEAHSPIFFREREEKYGREQNSEWHLLEHRPL
jgi:hypothetical protein